MLHCALFHDALWTVQGPVPSPTLPDITDFTVQTPQKCTTGIDFDLQVGVEGDSILANRFSDLSAILKTIEEQNVFEAFQISGM